jgi:hypothetical protein
MNQTLANEIAWRDRNGYRRLTVAGMERVFNELGYQLDRSMDCWDTARWLTGERAGLTYPCISTGIVEADTGISAFHVDARRDNNYRDMQRLRQEVYAVVRGAILEV